MMLNKVSLNTIGLNRIGLNRIGKPSRGSSDRPYIDPEVLASLKAVCICYGKSNDDPDRAVVKNLVDPDNPFVISNAAFKLNSGFGKYEVDFATWKFRPSASENLTISNSSVSIKSELPDEWIIWQQANSSAFKIRIKGLHDGGQLRYRYFDIDNVQHDIFFNSNGDFDCPANFNTGKTSGFAVEGTKTIYVGLTIEQIPSFEGAFVTDGIDDLITSTKTAEEMGITDEVTVVSMIHQINANKNFTTTNNLRNENRVIGRNTVTNIGKTGIYGWYKKDIQGTTATLIDNILGDKNDYTGHYTESTNSVANSKFYVTGYAVENGFTELSSVAWYWNFISNKYLTTDQINQVIAYFNLDRTLKSDIYCNIAKQGITNENHTEFGDKLIDFSGNGRDIQLNNIAWKGDSGIGKYNFSNINIIASNRFEGTVTTNKCHFTKKLTDTTNNFCDLLVISPNEPIKFKVSGLSDGRKLFVANKSGSGSNYNFDNGEHEVSLSFSEGVGQNNPFGVTGDIGDIDVTVEFIPSHEGALCLDGVNDFGKVTGMPIYKDYTFIAEREFLSTPDGDNITNGSLVSKADGTGKGAFIIEEITKQRARESSFSIGTNIVDYNTDRSISYQSKYSYNGKALTAGQVEDRDVMWLGTIRDNDTRFVNAAIYSLMSFPYSMSKFLIERQLKKHKLGTLYPDMVEFRPIVPKDDRIESINYYNENDRAYVGNYYPIGSNTSISFKMVKPYKITSIKVNGANTVYNHNNGFNFKMPSKSPQKFTNPNIVVDTSIILFNPTINSNAIFEVGNEQNMTELIAKVRNHEIDGFIMYLSKLESKYILPNSWINKDTEVIASIYCLDNTLQDDLHINIDGNSKYCLYADSSNNIAEFIIMDDNIFEEQYITNVLTANTIDIQLDQYIRYEDIVQPYPVLLRFNDENGNEVSWGGKFRVGSTITRIGSIADPESNLLNGLYSVSGLSLNGKAVTSITSIVEKQMVFKTTATYLLDNNEPKCILSPSRLRIPNSSYKILGHIPDISGHGNHGVINNSAYVEGSGVNEDGSYQLDGVNDFVTIPTLSSGGKQVLMKVNWSSLGMPIYEQRTPGKKNFAIISNSTAVAYIEGNDGNTYIDGILNNNIKGNELVNITHNITITNELSEKPNTSPMLGINNGRNAFAQMALYDFMLFDNISTDDKIKELNEYVGIEAKVELPPYYWDTYGKTNLDEDKNYTANLGTVKDVIEVSQPAIFAENWYDGNPEPVLFSPIINQTDYSIEVKANKMDNNFTMMLDVECDTPLPAFKAKFSMVGTAISVDLKYYINGGSKIIDVFKSGGSTEPVILDIPASERSFIYGTNTDNYPNILIEVLPADNGTRYGLTNTNFAYDKMSGYGGYSLGRFDKSWSSSSSNNTSVIVVSRNPYDITLKKLGGNSDWEFNNTELKVISNPVSVKFKSNKNIRVTCDYHYYPVGGNSEGTPLGITSKDLIANKDAIITISPISQENIDKYNIDVNRGYYLIYFQLSSTLAVNEEVTIEMLPLYPNGLLYDGVTDYSENANIPALTDYTYVFKRELLNLDKVGGGASLYKGSFYSNGGRAFIVDINDKNPNSEMSGYSYGNRASTSTLKTNKIIYGTKTSINGVSVTPGSNTDNASLTLGKWDVNYKQMVFYKLILYPKTIQLLQINFLKNLMERDEIIDLNNPIFIQE